MPAVGDPVLYTPHAPAAACAGGGRRGAGRLGRPSAAPHHHGGAARLTEAGPHGLSSSKSRGAPTLRQPTFDARVDHADDWLDLHADVRGRSTSTAGVTDSEGRDPRRRGPGDLAAPRGPPRVRWQLFVDQAVPAPRGAADAAGHPAPRGRSRRRSPGGLRVRRPVPRVPEHDRLRRAWAFVMTLVLQPAQDLQARLRPERGHLVAPASRGVRVLWQLPRRVVLDNLRRGDSSHAALYDPEVQHQLPGVGGGLVACRGGLGPSPGVSAPAAPPCQQISAATVPIPGPRPGHPMDASCPMPTGRHPSLSA